MKRLHIMTIAFTVVLLAGVAMAAPLANGPTEASASPGRAYAAAGPIPPSQARFTVRRLEGDVTGDCMVKIDDLQQIANRYLASRGSLMYAPMYDVSLPVPNGVIDVQDLQFVFGRVGSTCAQPIPAQPPVASPNSPPSGDITLTKSPASANIWICVPGQGDCGSSVPNKIDDANWQNGIVVDEVMTINVPVAGVTDYSFELTYDPSLFQTPAIEDQGVLDTAGAITACNLDHLGSGHVLFHCTATGPSVSWSGPKTVAKVTFLVQSSVGNTLLPAKENGITTDIFDSAATAGHPPATPTATATHTPVTPTSTLTPVTPGPTNTPVTPGPTNTPVTPGPTNTPVTPAPSSTPGTPSATGTPVTPSPTVVPTTTACLERTQGYWRNHPDSWPVDVLSLGLHGYTKNDLLAILKTPAGGDASLTLAHQLIAAKLNVAVGAIYRQPGAITFGDGVLSRYQGALPYGVAPSSPDGQSMVLLASALDDANSECDGESEDDPASRSPTAVSTVLGSTRRNLPSGLPATGESSPFGSDPEGWIITAMSIVIVSLLVVLVRQTIAGNERDE